MKKLTTLILALLLIATMTVGVFADHYTGSGTAVYSGGTAIATDFPTSFIDLAPNFQPGDDLSIRITLMNNCDTSTKWYMSNEILKPFEDAAKSASGGSYSFKLKYNGTEIFNSDVIGGENGQGIQMATGQLKDFFYLGTLVAHGNGIVELEFGIDGETQNNNYWNTLSQLRMRFAVDKSGSSYIPPKTSDTGDILIWGGVTIACLAAILVILVADRRKSRKAASK